MLGEKLNFNSMMRPSAIDESGAISRVSKETHNNSIRQEDNEEKNYEKIVSEKTAVVNKKKPKMRVFNSNINKNSVVEEKIKSVEVNNKENCPFDEEIKEDGIKETKKEVKVEIKEQVKEKIPVESQKITVKNNFINTYDDPGVKNTEDNFNFNPKVEKSKFNFDSIIDKDEDNPQDLNVDLSNQTKNQNSSSKTPSTLFNFDDSSVIDNPTKNSLISNKNKFGDNSNLANKKPIDKKIKFLFEDE